MSTPADHVELKNLQTQLTKAEAQLKGAKEEKSLANQKVSTVEGRVKSLKQKIDRLTKKNDKIVITEHAMLRYLERVYGLDIAALKQEMMPDKTEETIKTMGGGKFPVTPNGSSVSLTRQFDQFTLLVKRNTVTSVITPD